MSDILNSYSREIASDRPVNVDDYFRNEGLIPPAEPQKVQMPEAATVTQPAAASQGGTSMGADVASMTKGAGKGLTDIVKNIWNAGIDTAKHIQDLGFSKGMGTGELISDSAKLEFKSLAVKPGDPGVEQIARGITRYSAPVVATMGLGGSVAAGLAANAGIDYATLDPHQERLSSLIVDEFPKLKGTAVIGNTLNYLADNKNESDMEGRFKNVMEGFGVGALAAGALRGAQKLSKFAGEYIAGKNAIDLTKVGTVEQQVAAATPAVASEATVAANEAKIGSNAVDTTAPLFNGDAIKPAAPEVPATATAPAVAASEAKPNLVSGDLLAYVNEFAKENPQGITARTPRTGGLTEDVKAFLNDKEALNNMLTWKAGDRPLTDIEVKATHQILNDASGSLVESAAGALASGRDEDFAHFAESLDGFRYLDNVRTGSGSEAGAALNAHKVVQDMSGMKLSEYTKTLTEDGQKKMISDILNMSGGKDSLSDMATKIAAIKDANPEGYANALSSVSRASEGKFKKMEDVATYWAINSMLSSPKTFVSNFVSNALTTANSIATNYTAAGLSFVRNTEDFSLSQANAYVNGLFSGFMEHVSSVKNAMKGEAVAAKSIKIEFQQRNPISAQNLDIDPGTLLGKAVDKFGMAVGVPGKMNAIPDAFFGSMMYRAKIHEGAIAEAESLVRAGKLQPSEVDAFAQRYAQDPPVAKHFEAQQFSQGNTFAKALDPETAAGRADAFIDKFPYGRVLVPFWKTSANIVEYSYQHSPFKGLAATLSPTLRQELMNGGTQGTLATAKILNGTMFLGALTYLAANDHITGPAPKNFQVEKALTESGKGWQPDSIKIGNSYVSIARIDPLNSVTRLAAIMSHASNYLSEDELSQFAPIAGGAVADFFTPEQLIQGTGSLFEAVTSAVNNDEKGKVSAVLADIASRFSPAILRDARNVTDQFKGNTMADPTVAKDDHTVFKVFHEAVDKIERVLANRIPWLSEDLPVDRNMFGEPILIPSTLGPSMISPFAVTSGVKSEVSNVLEKLAQYYTENQPLNKDIQPLKIEMPSKTFSNLGVKLELTPKEYERYVMYTAGKDPDTGKPYAGETMRTLLEKTVLPIAKTMKDVPMNARQYNALVGSISGVIAQMRNAGKQMMLQDKYFGPRWQQAARAMTQGGPVNVSEQ